MDFCQILNRYRLLTKARTKNPKVGNEISWWVEDSQRFTFMIYNLVFYLSGLKVTQNR